MRLKVEYLVMVTSDATENKMPNMMERWKDIRY